MPNYDVSARSSAAPATIHRLLMDVPTWTRWQPFESVEAIPPPPDGEIPGQAGRARRRYMGRELLAKARLHPIESEHDEPVLPTELTA